MTIGHEGEDPADILRRSTAQIAAAVARGDVVFALHAELQLQFRVIDPEELLSALADPAAEVTEDYANDVRGHRCLMITWVAGRALHIVVSLPPDSVIITAYWPDATPHKWTADFRRRLR
jgi:hypothetical protein